MLIPHRHEAEPPYSAPLPLLARSIDALSLSSPDVPSRSLRSPCIAALLPTLTLLTLLCNGTKAGACCSLSHHCIGGDGGGYERSSATTSSHRFLVSTRGSSASHAVFGLDAPRDRHHNSPSPPPRRLRGREGSPISGAERVDADKGLEATGTGMEAAEIAVGEGSIIEGGAEETTAVPAEVAVPESSSEEKGRDGGERGRRPGLYPPRLGGVAGLRPWTQGWMKQSLGARVGFTHRERERGAGRQSERERDEADEFAILCTPRFDDKRKCSPPFRGTHTSRTGQSRAVMAQGLVYFVLLFMYLLFSMSVLVKSVVNSVFDLVC